jgi:uncharacterized membrane protein (DUF2068 family)
LIRSLDAVRAVAVFEAGKGAVVLLAGFGLLSLVHSDAQHAAERIVHHLHLNPASRYPQIFLAVLTGRAALLAAGAAAYCLVRFVEAYGLWFRRAWAEWFAAVSGGIYIPFEIYGLARHATWLGAAALVVNILVVAFICRALLRTRGKGGFGDGARTN